MIDSSKYSGKSRRPAEGVLSALRASALFFLICSPVAEAQSLDHSTDELRKLNQSVDALIKKVSPSVVQILVTGYGPLEEGERGSTNAVITGDQNLHHAGRDFFDQGIDGLVELAE